jgi:glycosyltransferase involved in cell wall biosynthesis
MNDIITILTPVYGRHSFLPLWLNNIKNQMYPHEKIHVIVDECHSDNLFIQDIDKVREFLHPIKITHNVYHSRSCIGIKRNRLVKNCQSRLFMFFDSDDIYLPTALSYSYKMLKNHKVKCVGSDKMLFSYVDEDFKMCGIDCNNQIALIHEATLLADKKWFNSTCKFQRNSRGEGKQLFSGISPKDVCITDVSKIMVCLCHKGNTVNKDNFKREEMDSRLSECYIDFITKNNILGEDNEGICN